MKEIFENLLKLQDLHTKTGSGLSAEEEERLTTLIPPQILGHYERMRVRGKKGVSIVRNGVCTECHMRIAIGVLAALRHQEDIQLCGNCGRYLFLVEDPSPPTLEKPAPAKRGRKKKVKKAANTLEA